MRREQVQLSNRFGILATSFVAYEHNRQYSSFPLSSQDRGLEAGWNSSQPCLIVTKLAALVVTN